MAILVGTGDGFEYDSRIHTPDEFFGSMFESVFNKTSTFLSPSSFSVSFRLGEDDDTCVTHQVVKTIRGNTDIAFNPTFQAKYSKTSSSVPKTLVKSILNKFIS